TQKYILPKTLVAKMIPQMKAEEITTTDFDRNIFYGPIKNFPKNFTAAQREKFTSQYKALITEKIIPTYLKMANFLEQEYLPKARNTPGINPLPNGGEIYSYYAKSWTTTSLTPQDINRTGLAEVARLRAEMEKVRQQVNYNGTLEEFIAHVKTDPKAFPYTTSKEVLDG